MSGTVRPGAPAVPPGALGATGTGGPVGHRVASALLHELPAVAVMGTACAARGPAALCAGAVALAILSMAYARAARTQPFAREHLVDLWAMVLLLVGAAFAEAAGGGALAPPGHRHLAALASAPLSAVLTAAALCGWVAGRAVLARRVRRVHTLVSASVCSGMLAAMLLL